MSNNFKNFRTIKDDDYEEILDTSAQDNRLSHRLQSGAIINKMKDRKRKKNCH